MHFLTSPTTLRLRSLVGKLQVRMDIEHDLCLFDEGWRSTTSVPEARVNVPTALHSMHIHGRLREVHFLLNVHEIIYERDQDSATTTGRSMSAFYLPMARLQLADWEVQVGDGPEFSSGPACRPGREVIAPTFLASRAFQYGFLLLLREGVVGKPSLGLEVIMRNGLSRIEEVDTGRIFKCWLGATISEVLSAARQSNVIWDKWTDPFPIKGRWNNGTEAPVLQEEVAGGGDEWPDLILNDDDNDHELRGTNTLEPEEQHSTTQTLGHPERIGYKSRGDDLLVSSPIRYDSPTSSVHPYEYKTISFDANGQGEAFDCDITIKSEIDQVGCAEIVSQTDSSDDETEVFSSCLETTVSRAVQREMMESLEVPNTGENFPGSLSPCREDGARNVPSDDRLMPLEASNCLDNDKSSVIKASGADKPTSTSLAAYANAKTSSNSNTSDTSSEDECPTSRSATFKSSELAFRQDTMTTASIAPKDNGEVTSDSESSVSNSDEVTAAKSTLELSPSLTQPKSGHEALPRGTNGSSSSEKASDSDSVSSSSDEDRGHCNKSKLISEIVNSSMTQDSSSSDSNSHSAVESDSSSSNDGKSPCNKSAYIAQLFSSSKTWRGKSNSDRAKSAAGKRLGSAISRMCPKTLSAEGEGMRDRNNARAPATNLTPTAFHPVISRGPKRASSIPRPTTPAHEALEARKQATTGQKRKVSHDGPEQVKKSRKARRRANRRSRLLARTAGNE
ncbi:hypothetical protein N0V82_008593 [Gnomoniopsis sp. IMI 355080]|nr:hypothetical protein N0V82_008593 [Gnomoniopsis sp. IMI 355080]